MIIKKLKRLSPLKIILCTVLIVHTVSLLLPLLWGILASLKSVDEFRINILGLPKGRIIDWSWGNFAYVLDYFVVPAKENGITYERGIGDLIYNTLMYVIGSSFFAAFIPCITAYMASKFPGKFSKIIYATVIVTMMIPIVGSYPSELYILNKLKLYDTFYGIWIQKANFLGMYFLVFYAAFKGLSKDFAEAACLDGASELTVMLKIMLPLIKNVFFTVVLIKFIEFWNDYQVPLLYLPGHPTLSYGLFYLTNSLINGLNNIPMRMSGCILVIIPIIILFLFFSNKLIGNITMGGIKE